MSRIGKLTITIPDTVNITVTEDTIVAKGPQGELVQHLPCSIKILQDKMCLHVVTNILAGDSRQLHGTYRSIIYNMVKGVSCGFEKKLELRGVGYRSYLDGKTLTLNVGYSHPVKLIVPGNIGLSVENNTMIKVFGPDKELVGQVAASIRLVRPPEPYKGKGIRYQGEYVRKKIGKTGKK